MKKLVLALVAVLLLGTAFVWGFVAHWKRIFPYQALRSLSVAAGAAKPAQENVVVKSPEVAVLRSLPYVGGTFDPNAGDRGVLVHDRGRAFAGFNFYVSVGEEGAHLVDMKGKELHGWRLPGQGGWQHAELLENGDVLAIVKDERLVRLDKRSKVLWTYEAPVHHAVWVEPGGDFLVLVLEPRPRPEIHPRVPVLEEYVVRLSPEGVEKERVSLFEIVAASPYAFLLPSVGDLALASLTEADALDVLHVNHLEVLSGGAGEPFLAGRWLVSLRNLNTVAVIDPEEGAIVWLWGPNNLSLQHHPQQLANGHLLIFDNGLERSQILELEPWRREIVWRHAPAEGFFTATRGSVERLPNGNTLIVESNTGYVFEVTPQGDEVWRFANPDVDEAGVRKAIYRLKRFPREALPFLPADLSPV